MIAIQKILLDYQDQPLLGAEEMPQLGWALESGRIELLLGSASDDIRQTVTVKI